MRALGHTYGNAIAQHRRPVAQGRYLGHAVGNENHGVAPLAPVLDHRVNPFGEVRRKRSRDFVEQQDRRLRRQRTAKIDEAQGRVRQVADQEAEIEPDDAQFRQPFAYGVDGGTGEAHVLGDGQVRHEGGVLIDGDDPRAARLRRRSERTGHALHQDLTAIGGKDAGDDLHQRALARPVRPHQTVNLAWTHLKRGGFKRDNQVEPLGHIPGFKKKGGFAHGNPELT